MVIGVTDVKLTDEQIERLNTALGSIATAVGIVRRARAGKSTKGLEVAYLKTANDKLVDAYAKLFHKGETP